jgi:hypothetical protein
MKPGSSILRSQTRGSSKLVRSHSCPGSKTNDYLTIDCSGCDGPQDLGQLRCLRGCVRAVSELDEIDRICLSRDIVVEYHGRSVVMLQKLSSPLARFGPARRMASRKCLKCPIEPSRMFDQLWANWPPMPPPESFRVPFHQGGERCISCRNRTLAAMEAIRSEFSALSLQMNQLAVKVLGARQ